MIQTKGFEFQPFSKKQRQLLTWWAEGSPHKDKAGVIADGSIRSGKTIACICSFLMFTLKTFVGQNFIIAGKSMGALKRNVISPMLQILEAWHVEYLYNRSENRIQIGTNTYHLFGASNEASQDVLQGLTSAGAYADEGALFPKSFIDQMIGRCSIEGAKIFINCNPESPSHHIKTELIDKADDKNLLRLHFTMGDNLTLSSETITRYEQMFTGVFYKRFIEGLWVSAEGIIYRQLADEPDRYVIDKAPKDIDYATIGVDYGGTGSGHSFTLTGFTKGFKEIITLDEFYLKKHITPEELNGYFADFVKKSQASYPVFEAYCDSAEQVLIAGFKSAVARQGLAIDVKNAKKTKINDRIAFYNSMLARDRWKILSHCKHTIKAYSEAVYDDKGNRLDDGTVNVDSLDSQEYSTEKLHKDLLFMDIEGEKIEQKRPEMFIE